MVVAGVVAVLVVAPLVPRGWVLLLDWVRGPHVSLPRAFWGLDGGLVAAIPFGVATWALGEVVGHAMLGWLPIALALFVAGVAMGRLVGGPPCRRVPAALLYAVNPLVFERLYAGQVAFLLGYALLPLALRSLLRAEQATSWPARLRPALWVTAMVGLAPHFAWIMLVVCVVMLATRPSRRAIAWLAGLGAATLAANAYLLLASVGRPAPVNVGRADLLSFRTSGAGGLGLYGNVAGLHGFWRRAEIALPKDEVPGWLLFLAAVLLVAGAGAVVALRRPAHRRLAAVVLGSGAVGYLLALGDQGPFGAVYRVLFDNVPGFAVMREPQKFAALVALAYAVLFGFGAEALVDGVDGRRARKAWAAVGVALPVLLTPTVFWGLSGAVRPVQYPAAWAAADRLMGDGPGKILFLPWHQYLGFPFSGRVVANPAPQAFRREAIVGDNVELRRVRTASRTTRSAFFEFLYSEGKNLRSFGALVAPHGVAYVVVAKTVDWRSYAWLEDQDDLEKVMDQGDLVVYRNQVRGADAAGHRVARSWTVADWGEVAGLAGVTDVTGLALDVARQGPGPVRVPAALPPDPPPPPGPAVSRRSPVTTRVPAGDGPFVVLAEPFDPSWRLARGGPAREGAGGTTILGAGPGLADARFGQVNRIVAGYALSAAALTALVVAGRFRSRSRIERDDGYA